MQLTNSESRYGLVAIILHWIIAILLIVLIIIGLYMTRIPISVWKLKLFRWHKELGILVLFLVILRLLWRFANKVPALFEIPPWQRISAHVVHWLFYFLMITLPISGWLLTSAAGLPASFYGLFILPDLITANETQRLLYTQIHIWLAYALIAILFLHAAAALKHHFIDKNDILRRML